MNYHILDEETKEPVSVFDKLEKQRIFFLNGEIDEGLATYISASLLLKDSEDSESDIQIIINSNGGHIRDVLMIYDTMRMIKSPIVTLGSGAVENESLLLLAAGTPGKRMLTANTTVLLDKVNHYGSGYADLTDAAIRQKMLHSVNKTFVSAMKKHMNSTDKDLFKVKRYLTPSQSQKLGIVDAVVKGVLK